MLTQLVIDMLSQNRRAQIDLGHLLNPLKALHDAKVYSEWICKLLQKCDQLMFMKTTKYFSKNYFDRYLDYLGINQRIFNPYNIYLLILSVLKLAAKFNQNSEISDRFTLQACVAYSQNRHTTQDFINFQFQILMVLNYKLKITTPYDYLIPISQVIPTLGIRFTQRTQSIIDFSLTLYELTEFNAQDIYFGCLLLCVEKSRDSFIDSLTFDLINAHIKDQNKAKIVKSIILDHLNLLMG